MNIKLRYVILGAVALVFGTVATVLLGIAMLSNRAEAKFESVEASITTTTVDVDGTVSDILATDSNMASMADTICDTAQQTSSAREFTQVMERTAVYFNRETGHNFAPDEFTMAMVLLAKNHCPREMDRLGLNF